jgi:hypothetical protein
MSHLGIVAEEKEGEGEGEEERRRPRTEHSKEGQEGNDRNQFIEGKAAMPKGGLLAMPSRRDNLTYRAVLLKGGEEEKRRAVVAILKASQTEGEGEGEGGGAFVLEQSTR